MSFVEVIVTSATTVSIIMLDNSFSLKRDHECEILLCRILFPFRNRNTAWKVSKYEVFSGPYFPKFRLDARKYRLEKTLYLDTFHAVK